MKEYIPSGKSLKELEADLKRLEEQSAKLTEWPDVDNYYDDEEE